MAQSLTSLKDGWKVRVKKKKKIRKKISRKKIETFLTGGKMCGRRGYCRNHITRRAPLREKMVSVKDKSLRTWYFLCSIWRRVHVGSELQ